MSDNKELKQSITKIVDLMVQIDGFRDAISEIKKEIKANYDIPIATITKVATIIRKQNLDEEEAKWEEIKDYISTCS